MNINMLYILDLFLMLLVSKWDSNLRTLRLVTNSKLLIPLSFQPGGVNLLYFKLWIYCLSEVILKYQRPTTSGCNDIKMRKLEFETSI